MQTKLKSDVIGLVGAATLGVVMLSPAMTLYGVFGPAFLAAGKASPIAFVWAFVATLPTAMSYVLLSRDHPTSGSAARWAAMATSPAVGTWAGWIVFLYYFTNVVIQPVTLGLFSNDLVTIFHGSVGFASYLAGILVCCLWPGWIVYRGISLSTRGALGFLFFESAIVFVLCLTVVWVSARQGVGFSMDRFQLSSSANGSSGIFRALIFAMLAYCGFDVVSTVAEETRTAKKLIPYATILSLLIYAVFITLGVWCLTYGETPERLKIIAEEGRMPITEIAAVFWKRGSVLITLTAISACLGLTVATAVGASRILFSMARDGSAPPFFASLHPKYQVPWSALHLIFLGAVVGALVSYPLMGPYNSYVWWGSTSVFFAMLTYILVNSSNLILNRSRILRSPLDFFLYALIPLLGLGADFYILIKAFLIELWNQDWATGKSVVAFDLSCAFAVLCWVLVRPKPSKHIA